MWWRKLYYPAAKIIGNEGKIYAVDEDGYKLKDLQEKVKSANLQKYKNNKNLWGAKLWI